VIAHGVSLPALVVLGASATSDAPIGGTGNGFDTRFADDLAVLAAHGVSRVRLGFDWSRLQPRAAMGHDLDGRWVEWYSDVITAARTVGIGIWPILLDRNVPRWFDDERGFTDAKSADRHWPRFVEAVAEVFGDRVAGWFPIDDPIAFAARREPADATRHGELVDTMVVAWRNAWRVLRGGPPVAGSFGVRTVRPVDATVPAAEAARRQDHLRWKTFLRGLRDGTVVIPGRADRVLPDLAGAIDIVGVKLRSDLAEDSVIDDESLRRWEERALSMLHRVAEEGPDLPITVAAYRASRSARTENAADAELFTEATVRALASAWQDGVAIDSAYFEPGIAATKDTQESAYLDWDRHLTPAGTAWAGLPKDVSPT
jgi:beta-glucosidase